jgi:hypothetical protein
MKHEKSLIERHLDAMYEKMVEKLDKAYIEKVLDPSYNNPKKEPNLLNREKERNDLYIIFCTF